MNMEKIKLIAGAAAGAVVIAGAAYLYADWANQPELVAVTSLGCGASGPAGSFNVPLHLVSSNAPGATVSYGNIELPSVTGPLRLTFDRSVDGRGSEVAMIGDTILLPVTFGRNDAAPKRIRISCRDGAVTSIRYDRDRANTSFNVVQQAISGTPDEAAEPAGTAG